MPASSDPFAASLLAWFAEHGRHDLPWQAVRDPYPIWVSEIMLQQTQVATVIPYFERFIGRFPDIAALAGTPLDDVLALWSGLGYYARARNLHRAAQQVVERHAGQMPRSLSALLDLPGIGRSTAAAILALTWNEPQAILDGNVKRVLARFHAVRGWTGQADVLARLWALAESHTPADRPAEYTQAIMDLGATVCVRGKPLCVHCPVAGGCAALAEDLIRELPMPRPKRVKPQRECTVVMLRSGGLNLLLERRPPSGIWGGLLSLPEVPQDISPDAWCRDTLGIAAVETARLAPVEHGFTHFDLRLNPVVMQLDRRDAERDTASNQVASEETAETAASTDATHQERHVLDGARWLWYNTSRPLPGGVAAPIGRLIERLAAGREDGSSSDDREANS